jgi:CRISPR-associated protein Cas5h
MEAIKFTLYGKFAFFRKPEYNKIYQSKHTFLTFNQIPKTYVLGLLGAMLGLPSFDKKDNYYDKLKNLKISIIPSRAHFMKTKHFYSDHTGLYSRKGTLLVNEEILIDPKWDIIVSNTNKYYPAIKDYLLNNKTECHLYLGKNEFFANIKDVEIIELNLVDDLKKELVKIDSMFFVEKEIEEENIEKERGKFHFTYKEYLPIGFNEEQKYDYKCFYFTNLSVNKNIIENDIYNYKGKNICLF